ncbi:hypothetical protein GMB50_11730 [Turicibacter sanguinis]|uniref:P27 family phage terminase small subunit n=1 Tax=Turicibacter sanguinis TaxID=154288 RepID=UPI0012BB53C9|nr:P27 family phage terminase small subunit [Turicibacter sanguinis]MDB8566253.1 P27 family phage terminase small subunit [Turicibacter sanguinis]MDB8568883.1 P27 family phage terminase small subunit [Turicibacter sanguinis]MDB8571754.1 P27 family phage terminase small subunit [Turicibacter sanguinis]MDB8580391.1 P27 family phage terminase small subunit [Turicibacter sanguinis]MTO10656.1 hypothetical protein [Turicibacter sanguinis]
MKNQSSIHFDSRVSFNEKERIAQIEQELAGDKTELLSIPPDFTDEEKEVYLKFVTFILKTKVISLGDTDIPLLQQLAFDIVQVRINRELLREEGSVIQMTNNKSKPILVKNPRHQVLLDLNKEIKSLYSSLGLDVSSRNKLAREIDSGMFEDDGLFE